MVFFPKKAQLSFQPLNFNKLNCVVGIHASCFHQNKYPVQDDKSSWEIRGNCSISIISPYGVLSVRDNNRPFCSDSLKTALSMAFENTTQSNVNTKQFQVKTTKQPQIIVLYCIALHCIALHCIAMQCNASARTSF